MNAEIGILVMTAFSVGFFHTLFGPDHYIPFVAMARSNRWSVKRTVWTTSMCGLGHIAGSVLIGCIGLLAGTVLMQIEWLEALRGETAAWLFIGFGLAYLTWGIVAAVQDIPHAHLHSHADGTIHNHLHKHDLEHRHVHQRDSAAGKESNKSQNSITPWLLFLIFALGPCEVLIPLLMYPAAEANWMAIVAVVLAFSVATLGTMLACVILMVYGLNFFQMPNLHRLSHAFAGLAILVCGLLVKFGF